MPPRDKNGKIIQHDSQYTSKLTGLRVLHGEAHESAIEIFKHQDKSGLRPDYYSIDYSPVAKAVDANGWGIVPHSIAFDGVKVTVDAGDKPTEIASPQLAAAIKKAMDETLKGSFTNEEAQALQAAIQLMLDAKAGEGFTSMTIKRAIVAFDKVFDAAINDPENTGA